MYGYIIRGIVGYISHSKFIFNFTPVRSFIASRSEPFLSESADVRRMIQVGGGFRRGGRLQTGNWRIEHGMEIAWCYHHHCLRSRGLRVNCTCHFKSTATDYFLSVRFLFIVPSTSTSSIFIKLFHYTVHCSVIEPWMTIEYVPYIYFLNIISPH